METVRGIVTGAVFVAVQGLGSVQELLRFRWRYCDGGGPGLE